jgi:hypothetical protein
MVTMSGAWEDCVVRYRIYRPELFTVRASVFAGSTQYVPMALFFCSASFIVFIPLTLFHVPAR